MVINIDKQSFLIFDLDDTLYNEVDYLRSAFKYISDTLSTAIGFDIYPIIVGRYTENPKEDIFQWIIETYPNSISKKELLDIYRCHYPNISMNEDAKQFLERLFLSNVRLGIITDGRSLTQRNKLKALGVLDFFSDIIISEEFGSEKPDIRNFKFFEDKYPNSNFYYFGDNINKDFIVPNKLGWISVCLFDKGCNIHPQKLECLKQTSFIGINSFNDIQLNIL